MFAAFTDKLKRVLDANSIGEEHVASAASIPAATNISDRANNKVAYGILESLGLHFGSIAYCTKDIKSMDASNYTKRVANTTSEENVDLVHDSKTTTNITSDDDSISSGLNNMIWRSVYVSYV